ncbi:MAG TPA: ABC transporter ATP-binding protein [Anaerolineae bacterium]|nr:ABC transporter ATP-binding protein [Anaerolineae bacterium]
MAFSTPTLHPLRRLWRYARGYRGDVVLAVLFSILNKIFDLAPPVLIGMAVDVVVNREDSFLAGLGVVDVDAQLLALGVLTLVLWALESVFEYLYQVKWRNLAQNIQHELRIDAYDHVQHLELSYFEDRSIGDLIAVLNDDVNQLERFLDVGANDIIQIGTTVLVVGSMFVIMIPEAAWLALLPIPFIIFGSITFQKKLTQRYARVREEVGLIGAMLSNNLSGIAVIKSYTAEKIERNRLAAASDRYRQRNRDAITFSSAFIPLIRMIIVVGFITILVYGGKMALNGELAVGAYSVLVFMTQRLLWPLTRLGATLDLYQRAMASTRRIFDLLDTQPKIRDGHFPLPLEQVRGEIVFDHVHFEYPLKASSDRPVPPTIEDLSLHIPAGHTVALVGPTGAGKSTVVKLLLRFYDVQRGRILLDGIDIRALRVRDLRQAIGLVSQEVYLFHGTVRENIAFGRPGAGMDEIIQAARIAEAHDFIMALPQGYETVVGERGQKLSGGQRQRISLARAVLKDPPILVLDEATSSVDNETEAAIQRSLDVIARNRTTIIIAHRLSTVRNAHRIFVMDRGRIVEQGTHDELLVADGLYAALWQVQTGSRTPIQV